MSSARESWSLRGPAKACRTETDTYGTVDLSYASSVEFRPEGVLSGQWHRNPDGSEQSGIYEFSAEGRLVSLRWEPSRGTEVTRYEYDGAGRLLRVLAGGDLLEAYEYYASGARRKVQYFGSAKLGPKNQRMIASEGAGFHADADGTVSRTTAYDTRERPVELLAHGVGGALLQRIEFVYDAQGNLVEEVETRPAGTLPADFLALLGAEERAVAGVLFGANEPTRNLHRYDEKGRRVESNVRMGMMGSDRQIFAYNALGEVTSETHESIQREFQLAVGGGMPLEPNTERQIRTESRIHYEYDRRDNWVLKRVEGRIDGEFQVLNVSRRTIGYY